MTRLGQLFLPSPELRNSVVFEDSAKGMLLADDVALDVVFNVAVTSLFVR
jgi:hypothetical protein